MLFDTHAQKDFKENEVSGASWEAQKNEEFHPK